MSARRLLNWFVTHESGACVKGIHRGVRRGVQVEISIGGHLSEFLITSGIHSSDGNPGKLNTVMTQRSSTLWSTERKF